LRSLALIVVSVGVLQILPAPIYISKPKNASRDDGTSIHFSGNDSGTLQADSQSIQEQKQAR